MTKYIIFDDGYHSEIIFNNKNKYFTIQDFFRKLAVPHNDYIGISILKYEDIEESDTASAEVVNCVQRLEWNTKFTEEEFNAMWHCSYPVTDW